jgi:hypothetical protein
VLLVSPAVCAQGWPSVLEVRPVAGAYVPTGRQHQLLDDGLALGAQLAVELERGAHLVAGFLWIPTEQRTTGVDDRIEMAQFDLGAEWLSPGRRRLHDNVNPLAGVGVGLRAYRSRDADTPSQANLAGYASLGGEIKVQRVAVRLELRDYLSAFRGLRGDESTSLRNDVAITFGLAYHTR